MAGEFPAQRDSNAENVSIWWRHHVICSVFIFLNEGHISTFRHCIPCVHVISGRIQDPSWRIIWNNWTHWGRDKMTAFFPDISKWIFLNENVWILIEISFKFVPRCSIKNWFRWWLGVDRATCHFLKQWWLVYLSIYAQFGLNELIWAR